MDHQLYIGLDAFASLFTEAVALPFCSERYLAALTRAEDFGWGLGA